MNDFHSVFELGLTALIKSVMLKIQQFQNLVDSNITDAGEFYSRLKPSLMKRT